MLLKSQIRAVWAILQYNAKLVIKMYNLSLQLLIAYIKIITHCWIFVNK